MEAQAYFGQDGFDIRCEWGEEGVRRLAPVCKVIVIVDVLSFSTCVSVAVERGAMVYPYRFKDESAGGYATSIGAVLAGSREAGGYSLSPTSLQNVPPGTRLVLPSPNGATLTLLAGETPVLAGCLRNATVIAQAALAYGGPVGIIAAGERWPDGSMRPAVEDLIGAGAIICQLAGSQSPEAAAAQSVFVSARAAGIGKAMIDSISGRELIARGWESDVVLAAEFNSSMGVPVLRNGAYQA